MTLSSIHTDTDSVRLTREALYEQVWSEPMSILASKYCLSDVGLAKICRRMRIPAPGRGYWRKKEVGHAVRRIPLPKLPSSASSTMYEVVLRRGANTSTAEATGPVADQRRYEALDAHRITVPAVLTNPHPLVAKSVTALRRAKPDAHGYLQPVSACLALRVSLGTADRAMCVFDALLKALDTRGYGTVIDEGERPGTRVRIGDDDVSIAVEERINRVERHPDRRSRAGSTWSWPEYDWVPSGQLALKVEAHCGDDVRRTWSDGKQQRIEACLNAVIVGLVIAAEALKAQRLRQEAWERERRAAEERRALEAHRRQEEAARIRALHHVVTAWRRSCFIREYIAEVRAIVERSGDLAPDSPLVAWLAWAEAYAASIDPLLPTPSVPEDPGPRNPAEPTWSPPQLERDRPINWEVL